VREVLDIALVKLKVVMSWLDNQAPRQRFLVLVTVVAVLFSCWDMVLMRSVATRSEEADADFAWLTREVEALTLESDTYAQALAEDPDLERRKLKISLERQLIEVESRFHEQTADLIPPAEMVGVLKKLLENISTLRLVRMEALRAEPMISPGETDSESDLSDVEIYRHGLIMELEGDYLSTLRYLEAIEALSWNFFWESLLYEVKEYPVGRIRLKVFSLGTKEGWIGV